MDTDQTVLQNYVNQHKRHKNDLHKLLKDICTSKCKNVCEPYTKECACCCNDWVDDVDRPFMSYTDRGKIVISYCERHRGEAEKT